MISDLFSRSDDPRPVHFIGIAGAGMSALAELFARRGLRVTGCDSNPGGAAADLAHVGIPVSEGHSATHVAGARAVIFTSAIGRDHPELTAAREAGIPVIRRAEALGAAVASGDVVGVAGTHGKTTTTVMTTAALTVGRTRIPPGSPAGASRAWGRKLASARTALFVVEADEYDRSFLALIPTVAVVTNVEADHLDIYADLADIARDVRAVTSRGARRSCSARTTPGANSLAHCRARRKSFATASTSPDARLVATRGSIRDGGSVASRGLRRRTLECEVQSARSRTSITCVNALAAIGSGLALGAELARAGPGTRRVHRRGAPLSAPGRGAACRSWTTTRIIRPRLPRRSRRRAAHSRIAGSSSRFSRTCSPARATSRASSGGRSPGRTQCSSPRSIRRASSLSPGISSDLVDMQRASPGACSLWRGERAALATALAGEVRSGDVVITVGAGDITRTARELRDI